MSDGTVGVKQSTSPDRLIDNEVLTVAAQTVYRQRVQDPEAIATLTDILAALGATVTVDGEVALDAATLAALENINVTVSNPGLTDAQLRAAPVEVDGTLTVDTITGSVEISNDAGNPIPVSGTVEVTNDVGNPLPVSASSLPLPTGAATETTLGNRLSESDFDTKTGSLTEAAPASDTASSGLNGRLQRIAQRLTSLIALFPTSLGQKTKANSFAVTLASDQDALPVTDNGGSLTVDGTVAVSNLPATQDANLKQVNGTTVDTNSGNKSAGTQRFVLATDQPQLTNALKVDGSAVTQPVKESQPATGTLSNVTMTGSSVQLVASNASRRNLMIFNDTGVVVYVKLGSSASSTSFTVKLVNQAYYELPFPVYTGAVEANGASGSVRVTEVA